MMSSRRQASKARARLLPNIGAEAAEPDIVGAGVRGGVAAVMAPSTYRPALAAERWIR